MPTKITLSEAQSVEFSTRMAVISHSQTGRSHRLVVREFIHILFDMTGKLFPVAAYKHAFAQHFPDRSPSTATFSNELKTRREAIAALQTAAMHVNESKSEDLSNIIEIAVAKGLEKYFPALDGSTQIIDAQKVIEFFQAELSSKEQLCRDITEENGTLKAKLYAASMLYDRCKEQEQVYVAQIDSHTQSINKMLVEIDGQRRYALQSIEGVRGETRIWKERYEALTAQQRKDKGLLEHFRRLAYARGASIPDQLLDGQSE